MRHMCDSCGTRDREIGLVYCKECLRVELERYDDTAREWEYGREDTMTDQERDELRAMQDDVIRLAHQCGYQDGAHLTLTGGPTIRELQFALYPDWSAHIRRIRRELQRRIS